MNDVSRIFLVFLGLLLIFSLSFLSYDHIDNSYRHNEPEVITELKAERDSLIKVRDDLKEELAELVKANEEAEEAEEAEEGDKDE